MFRIPPAYRLPLVIALVLHICLIVFLFIHLPATNYRLPGPVAKEQPKIVQATAVDEKQIKAQVARIKRLKAQKRARERARIRRLEAKAAAARKARFAARKARLAEQKRIANLKAQQLKIKQQKSQEAASLKALQAKRAKVLKAQEQQLQQKLMQQQLSSEQNQLAKAKAVQQRGLIDRYKAGILRAIGQQWVVPGGASKDLSSVYLIQLAPGGVVIAVKLLRSSGNTALDRSAKVAILKASPLPVPKDPALFDNFRELRLTVSPKTVVKENNETS